MGFRREPSPQGPLLFMELGTCWDQPTSLPFPQESASLPFPQGSASGGEMYTSSSLISGSQVGTLRPRAENAGVKPSERETDVKGAGSGLKAVLQG